MIMPYESVDREEIWAALFAWLQSQLGAVFVTMGRRHIPPPDLTPVLQPALFVLGVKERHRPEPRGVPTRLELIGMLVVYLPAPLANEVPGQETQLAATSLNAILKSLDDALQPDNDAGFFSLGGLVSHCWIEGDTDIDPGLFGAQAAAVLRIHILVP